MTNNSEFLFKKLREKLIVKKPNIDSLKSCIIGFGFPQDYGGHNQADELNHYILENHFQNIAGIHYDKVIEWIMNNNDFNQIKEIIQKVTDINVRYLFYWINDKNNFLGKYSPFPFLNNLKNIEKEDLEIPYFHEITQVNKYFIVMQTLGESADYLFTHDGSLLTGEILNLIENEIEGYYLAGNFSIIIGDNGLLNVIDSGDYDTLPCSFLISSEKGKLTFIEEVEINYELDNKKNIQTAKEVKSLLLKTLEP